MPLSLVAISTYVTLLQIKMFSLTIDAVNQGNWRLSIKLRLACFVNVE